MILPLVPIKEAVSKAQYIFFSPRIRKAGQDLRTEIHVKFKGATSEIAKNTSIVYCIPAGIGGNNENISLVEHITGSTKWAKHSHMLLCVTVTICQSSAGAKNSEI